MPADESLLQFSNEYQVAASALGSAAREVSKLTTALAAAVALQEQCERRLQTSETKLTGYTRALRGAEPTPEEKV